MAFKSDEEKKIDKLIEIVLCEGKTNYQIFNFNKEKREEFLREFSLYELAVEAETKRVNACNSPDRAESSRLDAEALAIEKVITAKCKEALVQKGVDLEKVFGPDKTWDELKEELAAQLENNWGISREAAEKAGLLEEDAIKEGVDGELHLQDSLEQRKKLEEAGIPFTAKDGKIALNMTFEAKKGVAFDDTPENRKFLHDEDIQYIELANGHYMKGKRLGKLVVPFNWFNVASKGYNSNLGQIAKRLAILGAGSVCGGLAVTAALLITMQLRKEGRKEKVLTSLGEKRALKNGLTIYKEFTTTEGKKRKVYVYKDPVKKERITVNADDVRIPDRIRGVELSTVEKERFRKGELLELNNKGETFFARIDISRPELFREYYKPQKQESEVKAAPDSRSTDREKLEWISKRGIVGAKQIFGDKNRDLKRDAFLSKYGLKEAFKTYYTARLAMDTSQSLTPERRQKFEAELAEANEKARTIATGEVNKMSKGRGL